MGHLQNLSNQYRHVGRDGSEDNNCFDCLFRGDVQSRDKVGCLLMAENGCSIPQIFSWQLQNAGSAGACPNYAYLYGPEWDVREEINVIARNNGWF